MTNSIDSPNSNPDSVREVRLLPEDRGTLIVPMGFNGIWLTQKLDPKKDAELIQRICSLSFELVKLFAKQEAVSQLYLSAMKTKRSILDVLSAQGQEVNGLGLEEELTRAGTLQKRLEETSTELCNDIHQRLVSLAGFGVYTIRANKLSISPSTEVKDPLRLGKALESTRLREARVRFQTGSEGMDAVEISEASGFTLDQIAPPGWHLQI